jgi:hypothetical protein
MADVFQIRTAGEGPRSVSAFFYSNVERQHELLEGLQGVSWLPGGEHRTRIEPVSEPVLTVVPPYPQGIPEMVYPHARVEQPYAGPSSDEPAVVITERGRSRLVYFPGDIDRSAWLSGDRDLSRLIANAVRWVTRGQSPVAVSGEGIAEVFAWETEPGYALHLLNYNNPNMTRGSIRAFEPIGPQHVRMSVAAGERIGAVELLRAGRSVAFKQAGPVVEFDIPSVTDYEVAALYRES